MFVYRYLFLDTITLTYSLNDLHQQKKAQKYKNIKRLFERRHANLVAGNTSTALPPLIKTDRAECNEIILSSWYSPLLKLTATRLLPMMSQAAEKKMKIRKHQIVSERKQHRFLIKKNGVETIKKWYSLFKMFVLLFGQEKKQRGSLFLLTLRSSIVAVHESGAHNMQSEVRVRLCVTEIHQLL